MIIVQVLLQRIVAEGVGDGKHTGFAVTACRRNLEGIPFAVKARIDVVEPDGHIVEITEHAGFAGRLHCLAMIRLLSAGINGFMALLALPGAHKLDGLLRSPGRGAAEDSRRQQQ